MRNPKAPLPPRLSQPDGFEVQSRPPPSGGSGVREQIEPEGFFDDTQDETRPALAEEAKKALEQAAARRKALQPLIDKDAETSAMKPNDYQKALERLQAQRLSGAPAPPPPMATAANAPATTRDKPRDGSDPSFALAQLAAHRLQQAGGSVPPPPIATPMSRVAPSSNGTGPNRPLSMELANDIPSARDLAANVARRSLIDAKPASTPSVPPPPPPTDDPDVIKSLLGGSVPPPAQNSMSGNTVPMAKNALGLKPGAGALAPQRTPAPIAVVGKAGGVMVTDRPGSMPPAGFGFPKTQPSAQAAARPGSMPSRPPGAMPSTPPKQYDFKRWSSPEISEMPNDGSPVTFQVYTAQDVAQGRGPMRSLPMIDPGQKSSGGSIAMKVGLAVLGGVIVLITAAAVIMVSTDEPKKPAAPPPAMSTAPSAMLAPEPAAPSVIVIGDPSPPPEEPAPPAAGPAPKPKPRPVQAPAGGGNGGSGSAPKAVTPPPNPYGTPGK